MFAMVFLATLPERVHIIKEMDLQGVMVEADNIVVVCIDHDNNFFQTTKGAISSAREARKLHIPIPMLLIRLLCSTQTHRSLGAQSPPPSSQSSYERR